MIEINDATTGNNPTPAIVVFYYDTEKIFNSLSLRSSFRSRSIKTDENISLTDVVAISKDEKKVVIEFLEQAIYDIFNEILNLKVTEIIADQIFFNSDTIFVPTLEEISDSPIFFSGLKISGNANYNENLLKNIDKKIENCIKYYILSEWYVLCSMGDDAKLNLEKYKENVLKLKNITSQLRKPLIN